MTISSIGELREEQQSVAQGTPPFQIGLFVVGLCGYWLSDLGADFGCGFWRGDWVRF